MRRFLFTNCTLFHNELFAVGVLGGIPALIDPYSGKIKYYDNLDGLIIKQNGVIIDFLECFQDKIYALESNGKNLIVFDLQENRCQYIPLKCNYRTEINFAAFERYQSNYYIFPKYSNKIFVFSTEKNEVIEIAGCLDNFDEIQCVCRKENNVWILPKDADVLYCYDLIKRTKEKYEMNRTIYNCVHAIFKDDCIYMLNMFGIIYIWNIKKRKLSEITTLKTEHDIKKSMSRIIHVGNKLILLPAYGNDIKILSLPMKRIDVYQNYPEDFYDQTVWLKFYGYCEDDHYYYFAMCASNYLLRIEKCTGELVWTRPELLGEKAIQFYFSKGNVVLKESRFCKIIDLIKILPDRKHHDSETDTGRKIYMKIERGEQL